MYTEGNINYGHNKELMDRCQVLWEYSTFIGRIRTAQQNGTALDQAVNKAVESCIRDGILAEFLRTHRAEVIEVVLTEYDEAGYIAYEKKLSRAEGHRDGELLHLTQQVCRKLSKGKSPEQIAEELEEELSAILPICSAAEAFAPDYDCSKVMKALQESQL